MGVCVYVSIISAYILIVYCRPSYAKHCEGHSHLYTYNCPDDTYCCDMGREGCCLESGELFVNAFIVVLFVVAVYLLCSCCIPKRRDAGIVHSRPVGVVAVGLTPQTLQQGGYPSSYPQAQSAYPPPAAYSPYYGVPPPEYQPSAPNPVENPQVVPLQQSVPFGWSAATNNSNIHASPANNFGTFS